MRVFALSGSSSFRPASIGCARVAKVRSGDGRKVGGKAKTTTAVRGSESGATPRACGYTDKRVTSRALLSDRRAPRDVWPDLNHDHGTFSLAA